MGTMHRLYDDVAPWWPLISPPQEYLDEIPRLVELLGPAGSTVLELGCGGGHIASHLAAHYDLVLVDRAPAMLDLARELVPSARHALGDMRDVDIDLAADAVLIHDAIDYLLTPQDLEATLTTAARHLRPGGRLVLAPDHLADTYEPDTEHGGVDALDGRGARYLSWSWDPDPTDTTIRTDYVFCLRDADGTVNVVHDTHVTGLFDRSTWLAALEAASFVDAVIDVEDWPDWGPRILIHATYGPDSLPL
jgi:SAM-dependent methyltransferase